MVHTVESKNNTNKNKLIEALDIMRDYEYYTRIILKNGRDYILHDHNYEINDGYLSIINQDGGLEAIFKTSEIIGVVASEYY